MNRGRPSVNSPRALKKDARRIMDHIKEGREVFMVFNNDAYGYAPKNAQELMQLVKR